MSKITEKHPLPWHFNSERDTSSLRDANDCEVLSVAWDGLEVGAGGVNDVLLYIENCIAFPVLTVPAAPVARN